MTQITWKRGQTWPPEMERTGSITRLRAGQGGGDEFSMDNVDVGCGTVWLGSRYKGEFGLKKHI